MNSTIDKRYELKAVLPEHFKTVVDTLVKTNPYGLRKTYPRRRINNLYFDTPSFSTLYDHVEGTNRRSKFRLRWYGDSLTTIKKGIFEVKNKDDRLGWKNYLPLDFEINLKEESWDSVCKKLRSFFRKNSFPYGEIFESPVLINHYQRDYYETFDGVCRLTVDFNINYYKQIETAYPNIKSKLIIPDPKLVIEFKAPNSNEKELKKLANHFPISFEGFSKYVTGVESF